MKIGTHYETALISDYGDPFAAVLGLHFKLEGIEYVTSSHIAHVSMLPPRLVFACQNTFLSNLSALRHYRGTVQIFLRGRRSEERASEWKTTLGILSRHLELDLPYLVQLAALGTSTAAAVSDLIGRPATVARLTQLARLSGLPAELDPEVGEVKIIHDQNVTTFPIDEARWSRYQKHLRIRNPGEVSEDLADLLQLGEQSEERTLVSPRAAFVFLVSNGVGLGHISRLLAVAQRMRSIEDVEISFWCYSQAALLTARAGFPTYPRQTASHLSAELETWRRWEAAELAELVRLTDASTIVVDSSNLNAGLRDALRLPELAHVSLAWIRRGMWQVGTSAHAIEDQHLADLLLIPGDLSGTAESGPLAHTVPRHTGLCTLIETEPVVIAEPEEMLPRTAARRALGLPGWGTICLVNLGADALTSHSELYGAIEYFARRRGIVFAQALSPFARSRGRRQDRIRTVRGYPLAPYLNAFDGIISAAGYNSFHEGLTLTSCPLLLSPTVHQRLDDQQARASYAAERGWADIFSPMSRLSAVDQLEVFLGKLTNRRSSSRTLTVPRGAQQMAEAILQLKE